MRLLLLLSLALAAPAIAQPTSDPLTSGGPLLTEQAAYDVLAYDLRLDIRPEERAIAGSNTVHARITLPTSRLVLDLDTTFAVSGVMEEVNGWAIPVTRRGGRLWLEMPRTMQPGDSVAIRVDYAGQPRVAANPPWAGGFTWVDRADGTHWVAVSCQGEGADLWWPVKDHPSDEPDEMRIRLTVPAGHAAISNGRLQGVTEGEGTRTFDWHVSTPINNYGVTLYVAPYETVEARYTSEITGESFPITFYVLPEDRAKAEGLMPQILDQMRFMEDTFGPYPFRADKYAVVQAPYLGMEHQTAIAYGDAFQNNEFGFDWLHLHEFAHEWWGNLVTVPDWSHFWVHEGFATYVEALYAERLGGLEAYHGSMRQRFRHRIANRRPVVPDVPVDTQEAHFGLRATTGATDSDVYFKGAWFLHTLRYATRAATGSDDAFFRALRRMAYPDPAMELVTDGRQARFATTDDFQRIIEAESGLDLADLFALYLRQPALPRLVAERGGDELRLRWETPEGYPLALPVEVAVDGEVQRVAMDGGAGTLAVPRGAEVVLDPDNWILKAE